jgi:HK97 gp10 family phage protein
MANRSNNGLSETLAAIEKARRAPREAIIPALQKSGDELAAAQRALAETSRDTGKLIESIHVTMPGHSAPAYSQPGGSRVAGETEVIVSVGNTDVRYPHLVEYGTANAEAQPFFWPAFRLLRKRAQNRINRAAKKAVKDAWNNQ